MPDTSDAYAGERDQEQEDRGQRGRLRRMLAAAALVILIILIFLLLWKPWAGTSSRSDAGRRPGRIETVDRYPASETHVSVWLKPDVRIADVLARHGLPSEVVADLGSGIYVISAGERQVDVVVEELKHDDALYDAGRIYEQGSQAATP